MVSRLGCPLAAFLSLIVLPANAWAQAWVPYKGEGSVAVLYQDMTVKDHFFGRGQRVDRGRIESDSLLVDVTYGITDRLSVTFGVPYIRAQYSGAAPHPTAQDDGRVHAGLQDVRFAMRYNLTRGPLVVTPFVGTNVPTHGYEYFAHASLGPRVRELEIGTYVGRLLSPMLSNAFVQARYSYSFAQEIVGVQHNRSNLDLEFGYFVTPTVRVFTLGVGHKTHGGIDVPDAGWKALPIEQGPHHDRIGRIDLLDVGGGVQVSLTKSVDLFGSYMKSLAGRNTHALDRALMVGMSWSFGRGLTALMLDSDVTPGRGRRLAKCLCQK
jgi:hypothetical protein